MDHDIRHRQDRAPLAPRFVHHPRTAGPRAPRPDESFDQIDPDGDGDRPEGGVTLWLVVME
jgi:hypothetical protein